MARSLAAIPLHEPIVEKDGTIINFFRLRWQQLIDAFAIVPTVAPILAKVTPPLAAALSTTTLWTTTTTAYYRVSVYVRITQAATTSSSVQVTIGWLDSGVALTIQGAAVTGNTPATVQTLTFLVRADRGSNLTIATTYASVGGVPMQYAISATVEQLV